MTRTVCKTTAARTDHASGPGPVTAVAGLCRWAAALFSVLVFTGCGESEVKVYRVPKDTTENAMTAQGQLPPGHPDVSPAKPKLTWTVPEGWAEAKAGEFRVASFTIKNDEGKQADLGIFPLPGGAGGDFANVNRWRNQVGLEAVTAEELKKLAETTEIAGQPAELYEMAGKAAGSEEPTRILGAIQHREGTAWFFKMTGDDALVAGQKPKLIEFLKTLRMEVPHPDGDPHTHSHSETARAPASAPAATASAEGKPTWQVPAGWSEIPGGQFLVAKFNLAGEGGAQAAVNVSSSVGDGGGLLANVNRWRQQLGLATINDAELAQTASSFEVSGGKATVVDFSGTDARTGQPARVIGAVVPQSGKTWFYKLMGDTKVVESQREAFTKFVQSVRY